ncbi:hypothetical protein ABEB36_013717 [Hypothenemus hampei]|uniref:DDE-1 domain-containing protein n=1 Tax=Hypothenemus hampei TaxID=57062 RepID=A0ABD1E528_HYPHA
MKELNLKDAVFTVSEAWNNVQEQAILSSWKKLWPSINKNDDELWDPEDLLPLNELIELATKNSELDKDFILEWCEEHSENYQPYLTDDELLTQSCSKLSDACSEDLSGIEDTTQHTVTVKSEDALNGLDVAIKWAEENQSSTVSSLQKLKEEILFKIYTSKKTNNAG